MSLSPVSHREVSEQGEQFRSLKRTAHVPTVRIDGQLVPLSEPGTLWKAVCVYASARGLKYIRCAKQQDTALLTEMLYVCEAGAFEYKNERLCTHFVWLHCSITLGDASYILSPGMSMSFQGPPLLYIDTLFRAHTPFVDHDELSTLFLEGTPVCGHAVNATTYAVARYSTHHLHCIVCKEKFDSVQTWASHYHVRVSSSPMRLFVAGQRLGEKTLPIPLFGTTRFSSSVTHSALCDRDDVLVGDTCGIHVAETQFAVANYTLTDGKVKLVCIDPTCKLVFSSVQEWAAHTRTTAAPMRPFTRGLRLGERIQLSCSSPHPHRTHTAKSMGENAFVTKLGALFK